MRKFLLSEGPGLASWSKSLKTCVLAGLVALASLPAFADRVAKQGDDSVRLHDRACKNKTILNLAKERGIPADMKLFEASASVNGKIYKACYVELGGGVGLIYEDGDVGMIPAAHIKPAMGV